MITAMTYSDENYHKSAKVNLWTAKRFGKCDRTILYGPGDIDLEFKKENQHILDNPRGAGLWMWKPYFIKKTLEDVEYGDYVMYMDAGAYYVRSIRYLTKQLESDHNDILLSSIILPNRHWCKYDAFVIMGCDTEEARSYHQAEATYMLVRKTDKSLQFISEWLEWMKNEHLVDDSENLDARENDKGFRENRHDQTVLSLLSYKKGIEPYRGISDSSEILRFISYGENKFFGYSTEELVELGIEELQSNRYQKSKYPRIVVNARIRTQKFPLFEYELLKTIPRTIRADFKYKKFNERILEVLKNEGSDDFYSRL